MTRFPFSSHAVLPSYLAERAAPLSTPVCGLRRNGRVIDPVRSRPALGVLLVVLSSAVLADLPDGHDRSAERYCLDALDRQAGYLRSGRTTSVQRELDALLGECSELPQIRHDLAVIAARDGDWDTAIDELEASIALDERAADSVEALRKIHRWRAKQAYAHALGEPRAPRQGPIPNVQDSTSTNSDSRRARARDALLRDEEALDYELYNWWTTATDAKPEEHRAHYEAHFDGQMLADESALDQRPGWDDVTREIGFTAEDAVAVLRWTPYGADAPARTKLLLMRLGGDRWTIYEEREL